MFIRELFLEIKEVAVPLFKILIPFVFVIKFFEIIGAIEFLSKIFAPLMGLIGLPPELGIVWVTAITINIYAALVLLINLIPGLDVTVAQITILTTGILVCHNILIESAISKSAGVSFIYTSLFRLISAFIICFILHVIYETLNYLDYIYIPLFSIEPPQPGYGNWILDEIKNLGIILIIVILLIFVLKVLKNIGVENFLKKILVSPLKFFGIGKEATNIIIVGITIGLQYGGGILIKEVKSGKIDRGSAFLALSMLNLVHAVIEDTLLMMAFGGHYSGVLLARIVFGLILCLITLKIYKRYSNFFEKYIFDETIRKLPKIKD